MTTPTYPPVQRADLGGFYQVLQHDYELRRKPQRFRYAATITPDASKGEVVIVDVLTGNIQVNTPSNPREGGWLMFQFTQDGSGGHTITFSSAFLTNWTPSTTADELNTIVFRYDGAFWVQFSVAVGLS